MKCDTSPGWWWSEMQVAYIFQRAETGARRQAEVLDSVLDDVFLVSGMTQDIENPDEPYQVDTEGIIYPTQDLGDCLAALDPDLCFVHIFNEDVINTLNEIEATYPTIFRAGININETMFSGRAAEVGLGFIVRSLQSFDHLVAPSNGTKRDLVAFGIDPERITVIPTAIDWSKHVREPEPNVPANVGCLAGRISALKNQHTLVHAVSAMRDRPPIEGVGLTLTGQGADYVQAINSMAEALGVSNQVQFTGMLDDPETEFWPTIGVHALPSFSERLSNSVLEAARAGVPQIISNNAWADEFNSMVRVPPDDPTAWAEAIHDLLVNDAYRLRVAREQQEEIKANYATDQVIPMYEELFERVVDRVSKYKVPPATVFPTASDGEGE